MKKYLLIFIAFILFNCSNNQANRIIIIEYVHSLRIPYNYIRIELKESNINQYKMHVITQQMDGQKGFEDTNSNYYVKINKTIFEEYYTKLNSINYKEIIKANENIIGLDGSTIDITFGNSQNKNCFSFWSIDYNSKKRKLEELTELIQVIFKTANVSTKWL